MNEYERISQLKTACTRLARHGLQLAYSGDVESGATFVKVAEALAQGYTLNDTLNAYFAPQTHTKVAAVLDEVAATPSYAASERAKLAHYRYRQKLAGPDDNPAAGYSDRQLALAGALAAGGGIGVGAPGAVAGAQSGLSSKDPWMSDSSWQALLGGLGGAGLGALGGAAFSGKKNKLRNAILAALGGGAAGAGAGYLHGGGSLPSVKLPSFFSKRDTTSDERMQHIENLKNERG